MPRILAAMVAVVALLALAAAGAVHAGITIHFEGTAASDAAVQRIATVAARKAAQNGWRVQPIGEGEVATLDSVTLRMLEEVQGSKDLADVRGVVIYPHAMCEPLYLVFGSKRRTKNYVKTQFAGADVHVKVIELMEALKPQFTELDVDDEGEYWPTHDRAKLERHLASSLAAMDALRVNTAGARGPVTRPDGRILDIVR